MVRDSIALLQKGTDLSQPINDILSLFKTKNKYQPKKEKGRVVPLYPEKTENEGIGDEERLDIILEKIKKEGFDSLSEEEKDFLHHASRK